MGGWRSAGGKRGERSARERERRGQAKGKKKGGGGGEGESAVEVSLTEIGHLML